MIYHSKQKNQYFTDETEVIEMIETLGNKDFKKILDDLDLYACHLEGNKIVLSRRINQDEKELILSLK